MAVNKFSNLESKVSEDTILQMMRYARTIASRRDAGNPMMWSDELEGEFGLEIAKCLNKYGDKPEKEFIALCKRMIFNRLSELTYRYYKTHRVAEMDMMGDTDDNDIGNEHEVLSPYMMYKDDTCSANPECALDSKEYVDTLRASLSRLARTVFDVVLNGSQRMDVILSLLATRSAYTGKSAVITPHVVADALLVDEVDVANAFAEIKQAMEHYHG